MSTYTNPVNILVSSEAVACRKLNPKVNPDPFVLKYNGEYYAYATSGGGVSVLHSVNMTEWTHLGYAYKQEGQTDYWAPAVFYDNGLFYLYVSSRSQDEEDVHYEYLQAAVSERPEGPFRYQCQLFNTFSIDAHVVRDVNGGLLLFYSTNETLGIDHERPGTVILADRLLDPFTPEGKPRLIVKPTLDEEIYERNRFGDGRDWHTIEGAFHLQRRGIHYVMYSGNAFTKPHYYIGYSTARHQEGVSIADLEWTKYPDEFTYEPLLRQNNLVEGVGHNSVVKAPNNVDDWIVYHGRERQAKTMDEADAVAGLSEKQAEDETDGEHRQMRIDPLLWLGDKMWVPGPSSEECAAPALPGFRDLFEGDVLGSGWHSVSGNWQVENRQLFQQSVIGTGRLLLEKRYAAAWFEVNLRWLPHHMGGLYGAVVMYENEQHYAEVLLDVGKGTIGLYETFAGVQLEPHTVNVPAGFRFDAYHQLLLAVVGNHISVTLDGVLMLKTSMHTLGKGCLPCFGLATHYTSAAFAGVALTGYVAQTEDTAVQLLSYVTTRKGNWRIEGGAWLGRTHEGEAAIELLNPFASEASKLRFDVQGRLSESSLQLVVLPGQQSEQQAINLLLPASADKRSGTVHVKLQNKLLQVWYGRGLLASHAWTDELHSLKLESSSDIRLEAIEWTALEF